MEVRQIVYLLIFFIFYVTIGGFIFTILESGQSESRKEEELKKILLQIKGNLITTIN